MILLGVGLSFIKFDYQKEEYSSVVMEVRDNYYIVSSSFEKLYIYEKDHPYEIGDILNIAGKKKELEFSNTESAFDFKDYLNKKGVYYQLYPERIDLKFKTPFRINAVKKSTLAKFNEETRGLIKQLVFGSSDYHETTSLLREMHLIRIASLSGLFLNIIFTFIQYIFIRIIKKEKYADLIGVIFLLIYSIFTFPRFVVVKYVFIRILRWINDYLLKKKFTYLEILSFSGIFFLLFDYHLGYQTSFLLSYILPFIILFFNGSFRKYKKKKKTILSLIVIYGALVPFILSFNNDLSPLSIVLQIVLAPFLIIYYFVSFIGVIGAPIQVFINGYTDYLYRIAKVLSVILIRIHAPPYPNYGVFIYELVYLFFLYELSIGNRDLYKLIGVAFLSVNALYLLPLKNQIVTTVSFINVGQGDSCLIQKGNTAIMIDTGGSSYQDIAKETLIPYLKKNRIYDIDLLITTHDDFDHSGGVDSLIANFKVKNYIKDYQYFPIVINGITLTNYNVYPEMWKEENDESLVLGFTIKDAQFLIMGDAPIKIEKQIIKDNPNLECDVLKAGHHGSRTSSCAEFIEKINPKESVISCGRNNKYGHPHQSVVSLLNRYNVKIRRTDIEGTIKYVFTF